MIYKTMKLNTSSIYETNIRTNGNESYLTTYRYDERWYTWYNVCGAAIRIKSRIRGKLGFRYTSFADNGNR